MTNDLSVSAQQIVEWYALRWQIELFFKELKSTLGFHQYRFRKFDSVEGWDELIQVTFLYLEWYRARQLQRRDLTEEKKQWWRWQRTPRPVHGRADKPPSKPTSKKSPSDWKHQPASNACGDSSSGPCPRSPKQHDARRKKRNFKTGASGWWPRLDYLSPARNSTKSRISDLDRYFNKSSGIADFSARRSSI